MGKGRKLITLGVDIGGTKIETALVDTKGNILTSHREPTNPEKIASGVISDIIMCIKKCIGKAKDVINAIGVGVAGQIESETGVVYYSPNLRWEKVPLGEELENAFNLPVVVANDVTSATVAEWKCGSGKGVDDLVCIFIGTGVGGGIVSGGRLLIGCSNTAGELGHITVDVNGRKCHCGNRGCIEAYAGGWAIAKRAKEAVKKSSEKGKRILELAGSSEKITARTVARAYHEGDQLAKNLIEETARYLGAGMANIVNAFNPCIIVIGGGVIEGIPELIAMTESVINKKAFGLAVLPLKIVKASFVTHAVVIGAAALAREWIKDKRR